MTSKEILTALADCDRADIPEVLKWLSSRVGVEYLHEIIFEMKGTPAEEEWKFLSFEEMEAEEKKTGALKWMIPNVLPEGGLVYISAPPSGGKTWVVLELIRALTTGTKWMGFYDVPQVPVVMVDEEMGVKKILPRFRKLGIKPSKEQFVYANKVGFRFDRPADVLKLRDQCLAIGAKVAIVDTLTRVHGLDENDNSQMKRLFSSFQPILDSGVALIMLHHDRKGSNGGEEGVRHERMRGASEIAASADMSFSVDKMDSYFRLKTTKGRLVAEQDEITIDFVVEDEEDGRTVVELLNEEKRGKRAIASMKKRVLAALQDDILSQTDLTTKVHGKKMIVIEAANQLVAERYIVSAKEGNKVMYRLPQTPSEL